MDQTFEKRKKVMLDFISDDLYVPMKIREIAAVLQIPREQRDDLKAVLDALVDDGKITLSKRGKYSRGQAVRLMTGAPIPEGADTVIRQEDTDLGEDVMKKEFQQDLNFIQKKSIQFIQTVMI